MDNFPPQFTVLPAPSPAAAAHLSSSANSNPTSAPTHNPNNLPSSASNPPLQIPYSDFDVPALIPDSAISNHDVQSCANYSAPPAIDPPQPHFVVLQDAINQHQHQHQHQQQHHRRHQQPQSQSKSQSQSQSPPQSQSQSQSHQSQSHRSPPLRNAAHPSLSHNSQSNYSQSHRSQTRSQSHDTDIPLIDPVQPSQQQPPPPVSTPITPVPPVTTQNHFLPNPQPQDIRYPPDQLATSDDPVLQSFIHHPQQKPHGHHQLSINAPVFPVNHTSAQNMPGAFLPPHFVNHPSQNQQEHHERHNRPPIPMSIHDVNHPSNSINNAFRFPLSSLPQPLTPTTPTTPSSINNVTPPPKLMHNSTDNDNSVGDRTGRKRTRTRTKDMDPSLVHTCPTCGKKFAKKYNQKIHQRRHQGDLPFICEYDNCGKGFMWRSSFLRHLRTHEARPERPRKTMRRSSTDNDDNGDDNVGAGGNSQTRGSGFDRSSGGANNNNGNSNNNNNNNNNVGQSSSAGVGGGYQASNGDDVRSAGNENGNISGGYCESNGVRSLYCGNVTGSTGGGIVGGPCVKRDVDVLKVSPSTSIVLLNGLKLDVDHFGLESINTAVSLCKLSGASCSPLLGINVDIIRDLDERAIAARRLHVEKISKGPLNIHSPMIEQLQNLILSTDTRPQMREEQAMG